MISLYPVKRTFFTEMSPNIIIAQCYFHSLLNFGIFFRAFFGNKLSSWTGFSKLLQLYLVFFKADFKFLPMLYFRFCPTGWLEDRSVAERVDEVWDSVVKVIKHWEDLSQSQCPKSKSYETLVLALYRSVHASKV